MKDIDEELSAQIKKVFEDFDDGQSEQGWAALREKYPEPSTKKLPLWWISSIAATLILVAGWWLFFGQSPKNIPTGHTLTENKKQIEPKQQESKSIIHPEQQTANTEQTQQPIAEQSDRQAPADIKTPQLILVKKSTVLADHGAPKADQAMNANVPILPIQDTTTIIAAVKNAIVKANDQPLQHQGDPQVQTPVTQNKSTEDFLRAQSQIASTKEHVKKERQVAKNSFEVFTGTFLNYAGDNEVKVNAGFGLNANIKMSNSVFLAVGAGISQNKMGYNNPSQASSQRIADAPVYNSPGSGHTAVYTSAPVVTGVKLSAQLLAVDLPITVKFYPSKKQNFYIATGINSSSYLRQQYTYSYDMIGPASLFSKSQETKEEVEESDFKGFDFANSAIIAIGINQNIGPNKLIFEPYFKPAIGNMGEKNLRINTVGINVRFNFNSSQKK